MQQLYLLQGQYKIVSNNLTYFLQIDYKNSKFDLYPEHGPGEKNHPPEIISFAQDLINRKSGKNMLAKST